MLDRSAHDVTIRPARLDDAEAILNLHVASIRELGASHYSERQIDSWATKPEGVEPYEASIRDSSRHVVVAVREELRLEGGVPRDERAGSEQSERPVGREDDQRESSERANGVFVSDQRERTNGSSEPVSDGEERRRRPVSREDDLAGWGRLDLNDGEVSAVYVHPEFARQGVGSMILDHLVSVGREVGMDRLHLWASLNAVPFYEAAGFESLGETVHETTGGVVIECVEMERELG